MRAKGVSYDTGFVLRGENSRAVFDLEDVARDLRVIRDDLHCTAVRVIGGDPARLEAAAEVALGLGLEVWFSPYPLELGAEEMLALFADCAERAERVGAQVFVTGAELALMSPDFLAGGSAEERVETLRRTRQMPDIDPFLDRAVKVVRERFSGRVTYASIPIDRVDWERFDIVSVDLYWTPQIADQFAEGLRGLVARGKPVAITEFGCGTFRGAAEVGAEGMSVVEVDPVTREPLRLNRVLERDEQGQAAQLSKLLRIFDEEGVDAAFVFAFSLSSFVHRPGGDPRDDLDLASYSIVRLHEDGTWEPKVAFAAVAAA